MNNINNKVLNYAFPKTICRKCDNSLIEKSYIFNSIKKIKIELCDYHNTIEKFSELVKYTLIKNPKPENLFSDNSQSFHNIFKIEKETFKIIIKKILEEYQIYKYHFCCDGNGVMYYQ